VRRVKLYDERDRYSDGGGWGGTKWAWAGWAARQAARWAAREGRNGRRGRNGWRGASVSRSESLECDLEAAISVSNGFQTNILVSISVIVPGVVTQQFAHQGAAGIGTRPAYV